MFFYSALEYCRGSFYRGYCTFMRKTKSAIPYSALSGDIYKCSWLLGLEMLPRALIPWLICGEMVFFPLNVFQWHSLEISLKLYE